MKAHAMHSMRRKAKPEVKNSAATFEKAGTVRGLDSWISNRLERLDPESGPRPEGRNKTVILTVLLSFVTVLLVAPFAGKAFHIDDPMYLWTAKRILQSPLDFYGFKVNWYGIEEPMSTVMKNPPLVSYYLALAGLLFGWGEIAMHLAMIVPAVLVVLGIFFLARLLCRSPVEAALISLLTPVFLVSANTVMCDVFMLSFWVWAVLLWVVGLEKNRYSYLAISAFLTVAAALSKYPGVALIPLLFAYSLFKKRRLGSWALFFAIPILALGFYQWYTATLYAKGLLTAAADFPAVGRSAEYTAAVRGAIGLDFVGGCLASSFFYVPFLWRRRYTLLGGIALLVTIAVIPAFATIGDFPIYAGNGPRWAIIIQFSLFVFAGLHVLALAATDLWARRDAGSVLLVLWIAGIFIFASFVNWTINARSVLPMLPAMGILVARRLEIRNRLQTVKLNPAWALIPSAVLALLVTYSDFRLANCGYKAAGLINRNYRGKSETLWYDGHWGFQYYMNNSGAKHLVPEAQLWATDIIIIPENTPGHYSLDPKKFAHLETMTLGSMAWLTTLHASSAAGFYSDITGPLPFAFGPVEPERYAVWRPRQ